MPFNLTITNITNSYNIIYKYNYCIKLNDINDILNTIYYYKYDTLSNITTRKIFNLNQ